MQNNDSRKGAKTQRKRINSGSLKIRVKNGSDELVAHFENNNMLVGCHSSPLKFPKNPNMPIQAIVQTEIDDAIRVQAAAVLAPMGLTVPDAVRLLLTRIAHDHALPFDPLIPNAETVAAMEEARGGNLPSAATVEQFLDAISSRIWY